MGIPMGISVLCIMFYIMQWNARSLIANGQEFKQMLDGLEEKPELICIKGDLVETKTGF